MRRVACAVIATLAVLVAPSALAARIEVTANIRHVNRTSLSPAGRAGDAESALYIVRDRHGRAIGDLLLDCRWVTTGLRLCVGQLAMPLGTIALVGASRTRFLGQLAVVGGTGRYVGADGTLLFRQVGEGQWVISLDYERRG